MYRYKTDQRWRKFEFNVTKAQARKDKDPNLQLFVEIETALIEAECLRLPVVYIRPEVDEELRESIIEIIQQHQGEITEDEEDATHIIYPKVDPLPEDYARPTFRRGRHIMMHWYYLPESYDSWTPNTFDLPVSFEWRIRTNEWLLKCFAILGRYSRKYWIAARCLAGVCRMGYRSQRIQ